MIRFEKSQPCSYFRKDCKMQAKPTYLFRENVRCDVKIRCVRQLQIDLKIYDAWICISPVETLNVWEF